MSELSGRALGIMSFGLALFTGIVFGRADWGHQVAHRAALQLPRFRGKVARPTREDWFVLRADLYRHGLLRQSTERGRVLNFPHSA